MLSKMALGAIWGYQQFISPRKGFRCAYSVRHGGTGCSGYAKFAIRDHGFWTAIPIIRQRLRDCREAYAEIRANCTCNKDQREDEPLSESERAELERRRKNDRWYNKCDSCACEACACPSSWGTGGGCLGGGGRAASGGILDTNPCDGDGCGLDCGSADCVSCDCGGCSCG